jgi:tRNA(Arg) A34 adenosine deaminase TadA
LKQLLDHTNVFKQYNKYFTSKCLTGMIIETEKYLEYDEKKIIYESISKNIMCDEPHNSYPFDHFVLNCLSGHQINKRITRNGKVPYLLSGCIAILLHEPCTMCAMALLHSRIDAVIYFNRNICAGALGSKCFLNYTNSLNHHFPVYLVDDDVVN